MSSPSTPTTIQPEPGSRLRMKAVDSGTGSVDGAWWPRSRDLSAELPALLAELATRPGRIERVTYNLTMWDPAERRLAVDGGIVRLEGFRSQKAATVTVTGQGRPRLTLLAVPPEAAEAPARRALAQASRQDNSDTVETLLALSRDTDSPDSATQRWEVDGGAR